MIRYALRRLLHLAPTLFGVLLLTFILFDVVGGSPAAVVLGKNASSEALAQYDRQHGYDLPLIFGWRTRLPGFGDELPIRADGTGDAGEAAGERAGAGAGADVSEHVSTAPIYHVQIPYALLPGRYELSLSAGAAMEVVSAEVLLRSATAGESSSVQVKFEPRRGSRAKIVFEVPAQWRAEAIVIGALGPDGRAGRGGVGLNGAGQSWSGSLRRVQANPLDSQFARHLGRLLCGDLGESTEYQLPVMQVLREGIGVSLSLTVPILVLGTVLALLLGLICAARRGGWFDRATLGITTGLMSINYVIWVVAGQYLLAYRWRLFPLWGYESWTYLALPVLIGVVSGLAHDVRFYRTVLLDEAGRPHVRTALAKGLGVARVLWRHVLRNSMVPVVTNISLAIPFLFTGSILLESFFGLPGLGGIGLNAVHSSDVAMVRAVVLVGAVLYQMANLLADLAYAWLDPRVRMR